MALKSKRFHSFLAFFNEKTVAALILAGKSETAAFIEDVNKMWNILHVKSPDSGRKLYGNVSLWKS